MIGTIFPENIFDEIEFYTPTISVLFSIILTVLLLCISALASGMEIAFFSLSPNDIAQLDADKSVKDRDILMLREDSERTLATILITNNLVNVTIIMLCNYIFSNLFFFGDGAYWIQFLLITVVLTFLLLLFGEIMPKIFSRQNALKYCRRCVEGLLFARRIFWFLETLLLRAGRITDKIVRTEGHSLSVDELEYALELTNNDDIKDERKILQGIVRFGDETTSNIMTSRQDIVDIDIKSNFNEVLQSIRENNYSRIPVYQDSTDNIKGILYIKDLLPHLHKPVNFRWQSLIRPPYFVPETKRVGDLLKEFQVGKVHIAIVVDEFGGTSGLVTMEDILEEIVGEIRDEYDDDLDKMYTKLGYNIYVFEGKTKLSDLCRILGVDTEEFEEVEGGAETLAGLLLELKGDFLSIHEILHYKEYTFEILEIEDRRISRIKLTINKP